MKTIRTVCIFCFVILTAMQCQKEPAFDGVNCEGNCYIITGKVIDSASNIGIPDVTIEFNWERNPHSTIFNPTLILAKTVTNDNGEYKFNIDGSKLSSENWYSYKTTHPEYSSNPINSDDYIGFNLKNISYGIPYIKNISMFKPGTLKFHVKSDDTTSFDYLGIRYKFKKVFFASSIRGNKKIDTIMNINTVGGFYTHFTWQTTKNDINSLIKTDSIFVPENGESTYNLQIE